jgi:glycosyltransferase involved in cell wall biosynthesis
MSAIDLEPGMTVLACMDSVRVSGPARQLLSLAMAAPGAGFRVRLGVFYRNSLTTPLSQAADRFGIDVRMLRSRWPGDLSSVTALTRAATESDVSVLQTHGYKANVLAWLARRRIRRPWIAFLHGVTAESARVRLYYQLERLAVRAADRVVVMSDAMRARYVASGVPSERVVVVHNAVIEDHDEAAAQVGSRDSAALGVVARLSPEKGVDVALDALALLLREHASLRMIVAGDGPEFRHLQERAERLGIARHVVWRGHVEDIASVYREVGMLVIPSRSEGLPTAALEAMAAGVPVVATAVGGLLELIVPGNTGLLVPPENPTALAAAIGRLLDDPASRHRLAKAARDDARRRFSVSARVAQLHRLYVDLTRPTGAPRVAAVTP